MNRHLPSDLSSRTGFAGNPLDRLSEQRDDPAFIESLKADPSTRAVVIVRDMPIMRRVHDVFMPFFTLPDAMSLGAVREVALLGRDADNIIFAVMLEDDAVVADAPQDGSAFLDLRSVHIPGRHDLLFQDMRTIATQGLTDTASVAILGQAKSLMYWHARHGYCSACGAKTRVAAAGWRRECDACQAQHFPRTDPVVIMLAVKGDQCLLGRQPRFPPGMYSCLAGFVEAGETLEEAVSRELFEEAGIRTGNVRYLASQPWPFPSSMMIGCIADAHDLDLKIDHNELEDARWFSREEARHLLKRTHPQELFSPPRLAIANTILWHWAFEMES